MKTCPKCGAPQADIMPACDLCGSLFPGEKRPKNRFDVTGAVGLFSGLLSVVATVAFFYIVSNFLETEDLREIQMVLIGMLASLFFIITGPIAGLILSIIGLKKTSKKNVKGRGFAVGGIVVSSIMMLVAVFFLLLVIIFVVYELDTV